VRFAEDEGLDSGGGFGGGEDGRLLDVLKAPVSMSLWGGKTRQEALSKVCGVW
jgi:hypothetical protein